MNRKELTRRRKKKRLIRSFALSICLCLAIATINRLGFPPPALPVTASSDDPVYTKGSDVSDTIIVSKPDDVPVTGETPDEDGNTGESIAQESHNEDSRDQNEVASIWLPLYVQTGALVPIHFKASEASEIAGSLNPRALVYGYRYDDEWICITDSSNVEYYVKAAYMAPYNKDLSDITLFHHTLEKISGGFTVDTNINSVSGMTLEDITLLLQGFPDLQDIRESVLLYERKYGVNAYFILSVASHESGYGASPLAREKHNLFGIGAYNENPFENALTFNSKAESVEYFCILMNGYRENGRTTPASINGHYATDEAWASRVTQLMNDLALRNTTTSTD